MPFFYSPTENGFYHSDVHKHIPDNVIPISDAEHARLMVELSKGLHLYADQDGRPALREPPKPTLETLHTHVKAQRAAAYRSESDPLFFKAQRGEATLDEWREKVAEIKERYPEPVGD